MKSKRGKAVVFTTLFLLLALTLGVAAPVQAGEFIEGDSIVIEEDEVIDDDLFVGGRIIEMNGTVTGDMFAGGEEVTINGLVEGNLFATGEKVTVNGEVQGSLLTGGADVNINGIVQGSTLVGAYSVNVGPEADLQRSLYFGGFSLMAEEGSLVGRSTYIGGYQAVLNGAIERDINAGLSAFVLDGSVGGDVKLIVEHLRREEQPPEFVMDSIPYFPRIDILDSGTTISDSAEIGGELTEEVDVYYDPDIDVGVDPEVRINVEIPNPQTRGAAIIWQVLNDLRERTGEFISLVIIGAILIYFVRQPLQEVTAKMREETLQSGLWGLLIAFLFPFAVILAIVVLIAVIILLWMVTLGTLGGTAIQIGGLSLGAVLAVAGLATWFITKIIFGYLVGAALLERMAPDFFAGRWGNYAALVLGVLLYEIVRALPFLGELVAFIVILLGLGAIFLWLREKRQTMQPATA
ncbi:MAG: polymer-forming cytoskeletal protein [Chloroflexi bacterium]|nr:MAG: polymer-forming cytoskeletal protein [Chloroflexota bacterium]MBL1194528.1 polymer-forming cytoskeletal protein [Chloroflexota bacterium]NOH11816.1 hypothetical protein [Chloroflexota bacterium]